jgi:hypothetical protein
MKYLPLLLILTACGPKFKVGDCVARADKESWEYRDIYKIIQVGKNNYFMQDLGFNFFETLRIYMIDKSFELIACPEPEQLDSTKLPWKDPRPR